MRRLVGAIHELPRTYCHTPLRALVVLIVALALIGAAIPARAQDGGADPAVTPDNAGRLTQVSALWRGTVDAVAWSPRGDALAVGTSLGVWLYDAGDLSAEPRLTPIERGWVGALAFSPDGTLIAASSDDRVIVWDVATGAEVVRLNPENRVGGVAWGPDGAWLVVLAVDARFEESAIQLWDAAQGVRTETLASGAKRLWTLALSPDGATIAAGAFFGLAAWDRAPDGAWVRRSDEVVGTISRLCFDPLGTRIAANVIDQGVAVFDATTFQRLLTIQTPNVVDVAFSPAGDRLMTVGDTINLWDASSGDLMLELPHYGTIAAFSPDGSRLLVDSGAGSVLVIDSVLGIVQGELTGFGAPVADLTVFPDGRIAILRDPGALWLWDGRGDSAQDVARQGIEPVAASAFVTNADVDRAQLALADPFGSLKLVDVQTGSMIALLQAGGSPVIALAANAGGSQIAALHADGALRLWDAATGAELGVLDQWPDPYTGQLAFSPDGSLLAAVQYDETLVLYDLRTQTEIARAFLVDGIDAVAWAPDGGLAASWSLGGVVVWHKANLHDEIRPENATQYYEAIGGGGPIAYNPSGTLLAASDGPTLRVFDVTSGVELFSAYADEMSALVWAPDGTRIVGAGPGGVVRVWSVKDV